MRLLLVSALLLSTLSSYAIDLNCNIKEYKGIIQNKYMAPVAHKIKKTLKETNNGWAYETKTTLKLGGQNSPYLLTVAAIERAGTMPSNRSEINMSILDLRSKMEVISNAKNRPVSLDLFSKDPNKVSYYIECFLSEK